MSARITRELAIERFGLDPCRVGLIPSSWAVVDRPEPGDDLVGATPGFLRVRTLDSRDSFDLEATKSPQFFAVLCDLFESSCVYYFHPKVER